MLGVIELNLSPDRPYFQAHRGTYTTQAWTKKLNRKCELTLREAEMWRALASFAGRLSYPDGEFETNRKTVLKNQFHDIIPTVIE